MRAFHVKTQLLKQFDIYRLRAAATRTILMRAADGVCRRFAVTRYYCSFGYRHGLHPSGAGHFVGARVSR